MTNEIELRTAVTKAQAKAQALTENDSVKAHKDAVQAVKDAQQVLADFLSSGAKACLKCGGQPHGMLKTPEYGPFEDEEGNVVTPYHSAVYAVGCTACDGFQAFGPTPEKAVAKWNKNYGDV